MSSAEAPDPDAVLAMDWFDNQSPLSKWLANWGPNDCYTGLPPRIERSASSWKVTFICGLSGQLRTVEIPVKGTPPPPVRRARHV